MEKIDQPAQENAPSKEVEQKVESIERRRLDNLYEHAQRIISGEFPYSESLQSDLLGELHSGQVSKEDDEKLWKLSGEVSVAEINNCLSRAQRFLDQGGVELAKSWYEKARDRMTSYNKYRSNPKEVSDLFARVEEVSKNISVAESGKRSLLKDSHEKAGFNELLTIENQRDLFKKLLTEKLFGRTTSERKDTDLSLVEQIKQLVENGNIENLSLDLKTGRIHIKYKPKQLSLLAHFVKWVNEYDADRMKKGMAVAPSLDNIAGSRFVGSRSSEFKEAFYAKRHQLIAEQYNAEHKQIDPLESLRGLGIDVENDGTEASIEFDQNIKGGKEAVEALLKSIDKETRQGSKLEAGNLVQWISSDAKQWESPKKIKSFSDDKKFAFFEGSSTGILVDQLSLQEEPEKK